MNIKYEKAKTQRHSKREDPQPWPWPPNKNNVGFVGFVSAKSLISLHSFSPTDLLPEGPAFLPDCLRS